MILQASNEDRFSQKLRNAFTHCRNLFDFLLDAHIDMRIHLEGNSQFLTILPLILQSPSKYLL